jgi:competence protein ComEC
MRLNVKTGPVVCAALGTALAYYGLFPLYRSGSISLTVLMVLALVPVVLWSLSQTLAYAALEIPGPLIQEFKSQEIYVLRLLPLRLAAFAVGVALGIGIGTNAVQEITFGIPRDNIQGISGVVLDDPRIISSGRAMTTLSMKMVTGKGNVRATARGAITVFFPEESAARLKEFGRGTEIYADGILREASGSFGGAYTFTAGALHITQQASQIERFRTGIRMELAYRFTQSPAGDPAWGGLALALLVGIRDNLDANFSALYRDAGCAHILALSGMNLAILVGIFSFLLKRPLGLRFAAIAGALFIFAYCYVIGPMPSLSRSALMYFLGVVAILGMLKRDAFLLLCMAFLIQLAFSPRSGFSISFIFSYLALAGIILIGAWLNNIFKGKIPSFLLLSLSASLGAFIATAAVSASFFGILRPVGILTSLLVAPLATVFMLGSLAWIILNLISPALSPLLSYPLSLLYSLLEKIAFVSAKAPGVALSPVPALLLSILITALILWFEYRRRSALGRIEPFA